LEAKSDRWPGVLARDRDGGNHAVIWPRWPADSITCGERIPRSCRAGRLPRRGQNHNEHRSELKRNKRCTYCVANTFNREFKCPQIIRRSSVLTMSEACNLTFSMPTDAHHPTDVQQHSHSFGVVFMSSDKCKL